jgi:hypothetical protein
MESRLQQSGQVAHLTIALPAMFRIFYNTGLLMPGAH